MKRQLAPEPQPPAVRVQGDAPPTPPMNKNWPFDDPPNAASLTTTFVLAGAPILRVYHDFDGGWQFHGSPEDPATEDVARVVSLGSMIARDATLAELHALPYGWRAFRTSVNRPWSREKNHPFPTFAENGYYLEDAVWTAQYRDDVRPPPEDVRADVPAGAHVKLLFRFAAEDAERAEGQTERMWVLVTGIDEDDNYVGRLANEPQHAESLACGDSLSFHPLHIMEILDEEGE